MREFMKEMYRAYLLKNENVNSLYIKMEAQIEYCKIHKAPHFAPINGVCWACGKQIYNKIGVIEAASTLVTGCPYCHRSYCD